MRHLAVPRRTMIVQDLIREWRHRLRRLRSAASHPLTRQACQASIRVLTFLVSRYGDREHVLRSPRWVKEPPPRTMLCVLNPEDGRPARCGAEIASLLNDIQRCNRRPPSRWWAHFWRARPGIPPVP